MNTRYFCTIIGMLLALTATTAAQRPATAEPVPPLPREKILDPGDGARLLVGPVAGVNYNIHDGTFSTTDGRYICCVADGGTGVGPVVGGKAFIPLSDEFFLSPRLLYEGRNGTFDATPETWPILGQGNQLENVVLEKQFQASIQTLNVDLLASYTVTDFGLYITAGPSAAFVVSHSFKQTETIASPSGVKFNDGSTKKVVFDGDLDILNTFQAALRGGAGANIAISDNLYLNPEILYGFPLTKFSKQNEWKGSVVQGTIGLMFAF